MRADHQAQQTGLTLLRRCAGIAAGLLIVVSLVRWGGSARGGALLWTGVGLLSGLIACFGLLTWWLFATPIAPLRRTSLRNSSQLRQIVVLLVLLSGVLFVVGGFWDEAWHRQFGGFGNDFLWPPHMMLYGSIALIGLFAAAGLLLIARGEGGLRQRVRSEPLIALLGLIAGYLVASLPSDQLWHRIYGKDLTAWSLPHLLLAGGVALVLLVGVAMQLSVMVRRPWRAAGAVTLPDATMLGLIALATLVLLQVGVTEWDGVQEMGRQDAFAEAFWRRPQWLYPAALAAISTFSGTFTLWTVRRVGAATVMGMVMLVTRVVLMLLFFGQFETKGMRITSHLFILPPLMALDVWYAVRRRQEHSAATVVGGSTIAVLVLLLVDLPLIHQLLRYPSITVTTIPAMCFWSLVLALGGGWLGAQLGGWFSTLDSVADDGVRLPAARYAIAD